MWRGSDSQTAPKKEVNLRSRQWRSGELTRCIMVHVGLLGLEIFILSLSLEGRQKSDNNQQEKSFQMQRFIEIQVQTMQGKGRRTGRIKHT